MFAFFYKHIFKPLAFTQDPERVHDHMLAFGNLLGMAAVGRTITHALFAYENPKLVRTVAGITFKNPIGLAAGFDKNAKLLDILPYVGFGYMEIGSITARAASGNAKPRLWRLPRSQGLVVNYGLANEGVDVILERIRRSIVGHFRVGAQPIMSLRERKVLKDFRIGISVAKTNCPETATDEAGIEDYFECFQKVNASGLADYITINVSCPNAYGGEPFTTPEKFDRLSQRLKSIQWRVPVFIKLPCDYSFEELDGMLDRAVKYGYAGVILSNLTKDRVHNPVLQTPELVRVGNGGISGRPTFERSNRLIGHARKRYGRDQLVIIGCGGVFSGRDAKTKFDAGADLIQLITGMIYEGPQLIGDINRSIITAHTE